MKNPKLYYYVIDHCHEFAPTSFLRHCILVHRRFGGEGGRRKVVELAQAGLVATNSIRHGKSRRAILDYIKFGVQSGYFATVDHRAVEGHSKVKPW